MNKSPFCLTLSLMLMYMENYPSPVWLRITYIHSCVRFLDKF